jgi:hypothetical protein
MITKMKYVVVFIFACTALWTQAHVPLVVTQTDLHDVVTIEDPDLSQAFYGLLQGFPHTYEFTVTQPMKLFVEVLVPDIESSTNNVSSIIVREVERSGRVTEIARLPAKDAAWESFFEPFGGDSYRRGPRFEAGIEPGKYRVEVHTPDNVEKYVLVVGKREEFAGIGYFELLGRIAEVKVFFEKPRISIVQSPFVYIPLIIILIAFGALWYWRKKRASAN